MSAGAENVEGVPLCSASWQPAREAGGCNFCPNQLGQVLVVRSRHPRCTLEARLCPTCAAVVSAAEVRGTPQPAPPNPPRGHVEGCPARSGAPVCTCGPTRFS